MCRILIVWCLLLSGVLSAQTSTLLLGKVISDTGSFKEENRLAAVKLPSILQSRHKLELRFITYSYGCGGLSSYDTAVHVRNRCTVLTFDSAWEAVYYEFGGVDGRILSKKHIGQKADFDSAWNALVMHNILSLPKDTSGLEKLYYDTGNDAVAGAGMGLSGATCYQVEYKVAKYYRRYSFCAPEKYLEFYPYDDDSRHFVALVKIFASLEKR